MHVGTATPTMKIETVVYPTEIPIMHFGPTAFTGAATQIVLFTAALALTALPVMHGFTTQQTTAARWVKLVLGLLAADTFAFIPTVADRMAFATGTVLIQIMKFLTADFTGTAFHLVVGYLNITAAQTLPFRFALELSAFGKRWKFVLGKFNFLKSTPAAHPKCYTFFT